MKIKPKSNRKSVVVELGPRDNQLIDKAEAVAIRETQKLLKIERILVPVDFSQCSKKAMQYALTFARQFGAKVILAHVVQPVFAYTGEFSAIDFSAYEKEMRDGAERSLEKLLSSEVPAEIAREATVLSGHPARELTEFAKTCKADVIIIATHGYTGIRHVLMGSVAEHVVRHAPCPVLVVRENEHEFLRNP